MILFVGFSQCLSARTLSTKRDVPQPQRRAVHSKSVGTLDDCPTVTNTSVTALSACSGQPIVGLQVNTTAANPPYYIEFVRFDSLQVNPYLGKTGTHVGEAILANGVATLATSDFPVNASTADKIYYVYACLKPVPDDPNCFPFALVTVLIRSCGCPAPKCVPIQITKIKSGRNAR